jgi:hypothetical protein
LTAFLNLRPLVFGLKLFGWFIFIYVCFFLWEYNLLFIYIFLFTPNFSGKQVGRKTRLSCTSFRISLFLCLPRKNAKTSIKMYRKLRLPYFMSVKSDLVH